MGSNQLVWLVLLAGLAACGGPEVRAEPPGTGRVVDSILPREEALRRFRENLQPVDSLTGGMESRDALVAAFVRALASADTAAIAGLAVSRSEFAYLYYPTAAMGRPPYDLEPGLLWFMLTTHSDEGLARALQLYGGKPMSLIDYDCGTGRQQEGDNTVYGPCVVRWRNVNGDTLSVRLFNQILERAGRFKFLSYGNRLD
jgi:hypothetical protein